MQFNLKSVAYYNFFQVFRVTQVMQFKRDFRFPKTFRPLEVFRQMLAEPQNSGNLKNQKSEIIFTFQGGLICSLKSEKKRFQITSEST